MNDPINDIQPTTPDTKVDSLSEQSSIDAALDPTSNAATTTTTTTAMPEPAPLSPPPLSIPTTPPQDAPLTSTTTVTTNTNPPSLPTTPPLQPLTPPTSNVAMGDDTPLAFASMPSSPTTTTTTTTTTPPSLGAKDTSYVPPLPGVEPTTSTTTVEVAPPKKKSKMGKILAMFFGFVLLGASVFGGYWYYDNYLVERATIAAITSQSECNGCRNGGWLVWRNGQCKVTGICGSEVPGKNTENPAPTPTAEVGAGAGNTCGAGYHYCGGAINKCVSEGALNAAGGGCNRYGEVVYGIPTVYGANYQSVSFGAACPAGFPKKCNCGGDTTVCFDKTGICDQDDANSQGAAGTNYNTQGLCAVAGSYTGENFQLSGTNTSNYTCTDTGCTANVGTCTTVRYTCGGTVGGNSCTNTSSTFQSVTQAATTTGFAGRCGTVEQLDVMCNGQYVTSRTRINPPCSTSSTPPSAPPSSPPSTPPTMSCTGITRTPTTASPLVGAKLTFTCTGVVTPPTAGTLSYKFRYSLNSGAVIALPNKTATTAELTIAACGSYSVQCQACATLNGVLTCNPTWTGATQ